MKNEVLIDTSIAGLFGRHIADEGFSAGLYMPSGWIVVLTA